MNSPINLKELWAKQSSAVPDMAELFLKADQLKRSHLRKLIITNVLLLTTSGFICFIWIYFEPQFLSTKIGIALILLAMAIFLAVYNQNIPLLKKQDEEQNSAVYLKNLLVLKNKQKFLQSHMLSLYFVLLSLGVGLYMIEYCMQMTFVWALCAYGLTALWVLFNWFYIRPRQIKKQESKLNEVIAKFEVISRQMQD